MYSYVYSISFEGSNRNISQSFELCNKKNNNNNDQFNLKAEQSLVTTNCNKFIFKIK